MSQPSPDRSNAALVTYAARLGRVLSRSATPGVPAATLRLLSLLDELGPSGVSRLARADRCSQPTMSAGVQALVDKGWAAKDADPDDARGALVRLTPAGRDALSGARLAIADVVARRLDADPCHGPADVAAAVELLEHLLAPDLEGAS